MAMDDTDSACPNCSEPRPPGVLTCAGCGWTPHQRGWWWTLLYGLVGLIGLAMTGVGGLCSLGAVAMAPMGLVLLLITVPVVLLGVALLGVATRASDDTGAAMKRRFGPTGGSPGAGTGA